MQTGDIILFSDTTFLPSRIIEFASQSIYSHIGIIVKDILGLPNDKIFILESTGFSDIPDALDSKIKWGVQIRAFEKVKNEYNGRIFHRALSCDRTAEFYETLEKVYSFVHDKSYNTSPVEWFNLLIGKEVIDEDSLSSHTSFVCSSLVAFIYKNLDLISTHEFSLARPKDFGTEDFGADKRRVTFINCILDKEIIQLL